MSSSLSINSLIAQLTPGIILPSSRQPTAIPAGSVPESGVVFVRQQGQPGSAENQPRLVYTRKEASGALQNRVAEDEPGSKAEANETLSPSVDDADAESNASSPAETKKKSSGELLSKAEMAVVSELKQADQAVRAHEMAHLAAAGGFARGGATFSYQRGPDGQNYAVGGEVQIDTGKEATPEATIVKMQIVRQAALAPADPSPQDQRVASYATLQISEASRELFSSRSSREVQPQPLGNSVTEDETSRDIYQRAGRDIGQGDNGSDSPSVKKAFFAYSTPKPSPFDQEKSVIDRIV
ncbi:MAG: hypothetical protein KKD63_13590 [Proteobacteria bacterium]|nr:hypothetical protein [Desulfobulbaceae bacterium]MBU4153900.1 hypothetical protein [Pseudomonadota bacterium]MDP2107059.1 putative metalloprotease CJM1_0395 family protein [Desulfobulbaceae bacterium]